MRASIKTFSASSVRPRDLLKRFALGQFVKGDEKLAVGALGEGFDAIFPAFFLEEAETVVALEEIEETLDFGGGQIGDADGAGFISGRRLRGMSPVTELCGWSEDRSARFRQPESGSMAM